MYNNVRSQGLHKVSNLVLLICNSFRAQSEKTSKLIHQFSHDHRPLLQAIQLIPVLGCDGSVEKPLIKLISKLLPGHLAHIILELHHLPLDPSVHGQVVGRIMNLFHYHLALFLP